MAAVYAVKHAEALSEILAQRYMECGWIQVEMDHNVNKKCSMSFAKT